MAVSSALLVNLLFAICPKTPYEHSFNFSISPGFQITLMGQTNKGYREGLVSPTKEGFIINLNGENVYDGLKVFHLNPRFDENSTLVLNTKVNLTWGPEEIYSNHHMAGDKDFVLVIQALEDHFKIFENGNHIADYKYRVPLASITGISIKGLVNVHQFIAKQYELSNLPIPEIYSPSDVIVRPEFPIVLKNSTLPVTIPIPGQMQDGMIVAIVGTPIHNEFWISWLQSSGSESFHIHPQINQKSVHFQHSVETTLSVPQSPFQLNERFELFVKTHPTHYEVWVNGAHYYDFKLTKKPAQTVSHLKMDNSMSLESLTITY